MIEKMKCKITLVALADCAALALVTNAKTLISETSTGIGQRWALK